VTQPQAQAQPASKPTNEVEVSIRGLWKKFGEVPVLCGIDLSINRGEMVAIVGSSGCGKTVLLKTITTHFTPDAGEVWIADHESPGSPLREVFSISQDELDRIRAHWAVVFQRNALLTGTVLYNLALWPREIRRWSEEEILPRARRALSDVGLDPDVLLTQDRDVLSGGMAKRVAIARALIMDPALILYDEPSTGLDPELAAQIHDLIAATQASMPSIGIPRTSVVVTHDVELLERLRPRVVMLRAGKVWFDGTFETFIANTDPHIVPYVRQMSSLHSRSDA